MRLSLRSLLATAALLAWSPRVQASNEDCIVNLQDIFDDQVAALDLPSNEIRDYVLCPNAEYQPPQGRALLEVFVSNVRISCGNDGSSWNNCVLKGVGLSNKDNGYQVIVASRSADVKVEHVEFRGITFSGMKNLGSEDTLGDVSILVESEASVRFEDCHWTDNIGETIFTTTVQPLPVKTSDAKRHRQLSGHERRRDIVQRHADQKKDHRRMEETFRSNVEVEFVQCSFTDNLLLFGVLTNTFAELTVSDCVFSSNNMAFAPKGFLHKSDFTFVIDSFHGTLNLKRCCFMENQFTLASIAIEYSQHSLQNNYGSDNERLHHGCDHALMVTSGALMDDSLPNRLVYACLVFPEEACIATNAALPPSADPEIVTDTSGLVTTPPAEQVYGATPSPTPAATNPRDTTSSASRVLVSVVSTVALAVAALYIV